MNPFKRKKARRYVLQALYEWAFSQNSPERIEKRFLENGDPATYDVEYFSELLKGVIAKQSQLDEKLKPFLDRHLKEITPIELNILRLALFEILERPDVPSPVIINEAVELNKGFGTSDGFKYVNGVLDKAAKAYRPNMGTKKI